MQQLPLFEPDVDSKWVAPQLSDLPAWKGYRRICIDCETRDEQLFQLGPGVRRGGYIIGICLAFDDGPQFYLPIRHSGGGNMDPVAVLRYVRENAKTFTGDVCGMHLDYDLDFLEEIDITFPLARSFRDTEIAASLLNELELSYSLDNIAARAGLPGKDERLLREALAAYGFKGPHAKSGLHALPGRLVGPYGEQDGRLPLTLLARQEPQIDREDLGRVWDLESRVLPGLVAMRRRGVRVSEPRLAGVEKWARAEEIKALAEVSRTTGIRLGPADTTRPEALAPVFRSIGYEPPKTPKTGKPTINITFLSSVDHPVGELIRRARQMSQLRSTFCDSIREHAIVKNGEMRIHCTFNQMRRSDDENDEDTKGAAYGRLSCGDPNMQQQPSPDRHPEIGKLWRSIYLPDEGGVWGVHDYSQQEPRIAVHYAAVAGALLIGRDAHRAACEAVARYRSDPKTDFHDMMTKMIYGDDVFERMEKSKSKLLRSACKQIYLGLSYGMGGPKLCRKLGLPTKKIQGKGGRWIEVAGDEGQSLLDKFNAKVPFVRATAFVASDRAKALGYIVTLSGRRCRFPKDENGNFDWTHKAFNRLIQGASADQTKMALVAIIDAGHKPQLQVHDELDMTHFSPEAVANVNEIMENCVKLEVPSRVDCEMGPSWGEAA